MKQMGPEEKFALLQEFRELIKSEISEANLHSEPSLKTIDALKVFDNKIKEHSESSEQRHIEIMAILKPIAETYNGISFLGSMGMKAIVIISILIGIIIGFFQIFKTNSWG